MGLKQESSQHGMEGNPHEILTIGSLFLGITHVFGDKGGRGGEHMFNQGSCLPSSSPPIPYLMLSYKAMNDEEKGINVIKTHDTS